MPTRIYGTNQAAGYTPPTIRGTWNDTVPLITRRAPPVKIAGDTKIVSEGNENGSVSPWDIGLVRYVSDPLNANATISGTLKVAFQTGQFWGPNDQQTCWHVHAYVTVGNTDVVRGTLLNDHRDLTATEWPVYGSSYPNMFGVGPPPDPPAPATVIRTLQQAITNVNAQTGDRVVVILGGVWRNAYGGFNPYGKILIGARTTEPDLPGVNGATEAGAPWIEFSSDFTFTTTPKYRQKVYEQAQAGDVSGTTKVYNTSVVTSGKNLYLFAGSGTAYTINTITDDKLNVWSRVRRYSDTGSRTVDVWRATNVGSGATVVTVQLAAAAVIAVAILEFEPDLVESSNEAMSGTAYPQNGPSMTNVNPVATFAHALAPNAAATDVVSGDAFQTRVLLDRLLVLTKDVTAIETTDGTINSSTGVTRFAHVMAVLVDPAAGGGGGGGSAFRALTGLTGRTGGSIEDF